MNNYKIVLIPGDGIGPEIVRETVKILKTVVNVLGNELSLTLESIEASAERFLRTGKAMSDEMFDLCKAADAMLMGAIGLTEARHPDGREVNGDVIFRLRFELDLFAGVRPVRLLPNVPGPLRNMSTGIDYVIVRENVEGLYASRTGGCNVRDEVATDTMVITRKGTEKVVDFAFRLAEQRKGRLLDGKHIVTCVDKANVLSSYAFFRRVFNDIADCYINIEREHIYVDAMTAYQVLNPSRFDVVVAENMFGDIISDLSSATVGGLGLAPSGDIGDSYGLFQPAHGSALDIAGKDEANPVATILSAAMMLDWLADKHLDPIAKRAAGIIRSAVDRVLERDDIRTLDIGGKSSCSEFGEAVSFEIKGSVL